MNRQSVKTKIEISLDVNYTMGSDFIIKEAYKEVSVDLCRIDLDCCHYRFLVCHIV
jgi:hypothetical protein